MSFLESSTQQGGTDDNDQASSEPKIIPNEGKIEPMMTNSLKQEKGDSNQELSETTLTNQVVEPMSRGNIKRWKLWKQI